ncbi:MAG: DNA polymerase III subunit gamma/tau [Actinobacteria bacterium]|nr:DNA polymerase III subunit gamma/tau [Actinomycetota bacterium]
MSAPSLYRRYRPARFEQVRGQDHVVGPIRNAVRTETESHAYLFSGPRGTGKTSTARILAKALNCHDLRDGEPCGVCDSCVAIDAGSSMDLFELDAASNNKVDDMRSLIGGTVVASPGRTKVYILDEVHMLSTGASNALLKTLEEPPNGVCFVLATTDPNKVLPTIRSRTQHFEFRLLSADELEAYVRWIAQDADLDLSDEAVAHVVRVGRGSARDTLSALDLVVAAGGVVIRDEPVEVLLDALAAADTGAAVGAVADALTHGHDPRVLAEHTLAALRHAFLASVGAELPTLLPGDRELAERWAAELGTRRLTRALERIGLAIVEMRQAADARVPLEVALVTLTAEEDQLARLEARVAALESTRGDSPTQPVRPEPSTAPGLAPRAAEPPESRAVPVAPGAPSGPASGAGSGGAAQARAALNRSTGRRGASGPSASAPRGSAASARPAPARPAPARPAPVHPAPAHPVRSGPAEPDTAPPDPAQPGSTRPAPASAGAVAGEAPAPASAGPGGIAGGPPLEITSVNAALTDVVLPALKGKAKALLSRVEVSSVQGSTVALGVENEATMSRVEEFIPALSDALSSALGAPLEVALVIAGATPAGSSRAVSPVPAPAPAPPAQVPAPPAPATVEPETPPLSSEPSPLTDGYSRAGDVAVDADTDTADDDLFDLDDLTDASDVATTGVARLTQAFPGAVVVDAEDCRGPIQ